MKELELAKQAAVAGGKVVAKYFHSSVQMREKSVGDLVSDADIESEQVIAAAIRAAYPDHEILGEETNKGNPDAEHLWIVDPLDGTHNFAHKIPHFAVSIGYYREGQAVCGVIHNPIVDSWYEVVRGQGAWHEGRQVKVADDRRLSETMIAVGFYYDRGKLMQATLGVIDRLMHKQIHGVRRMGTASLDFTMVGTGSFGAFFEYCLAPWDFAAGRLFVEEAGGRVTTFHDDSLPMAPSSILATNGYLHDQMLELIQTQFE